MLIGALLLPNCIPPKAPPCAGAFDATVVFSPLAVPDAAALCALCGAAAGSAGALATSGAVAAAGAGGDSGLALSAGAGARTIGGAIPPGGTVAAVVTGVESGTAAAGAVVVVVAIEGAAAGATSAAVTGTSGADAGAGAGATATAGAGAGADAGAGGGSGAGALATAGAAGAGAEGSGSIGATAIEGAGAGATSAAVTGTSGAEGAGAGATATAGAAGGASAGAGATAGCACVVSVAGADGGAPGTPPVTLIESSLDSSLLAGSGADAAGGAEFAGALRIESPTVPEPCTAAAASGDPIGVLTPSCAHAGDASAIATIAVATIRDTRLTLFGFFTIFLRHNFSLNLRMKVEDPRLGMPAQSNSRHFESIADDGHETGSFDPIVIRHEGCGISREDIVAKMNYGAAGQVRLRHVISVHGQVGMGRVHDNRLAVR
jgi:hypothetical protein